MNGGEERPDGKLRCAANSRWAARAQYLAHVTIQRRDENRRQSFGLKRDCASLHLDLSSSNFTTSTPLTAEPSFVERLLLGASDGASVGEQREFVKKGNESKARDTSNSSGLNFEAQLWAAADKVRGHMDAAEYKSVCLGLCFRANLHPGLKADFILANASVNNFMRRSCNG